MKLRVKLMIVVLTISILSLTCGVVFADNISSTVQSIIARITTAFDSIGNNASSNADRDMSDIADSAKNRINDMMSQSQSNLANDLNNYKNSQLDKKNQQIDAMLKDIEDQLNQSEAAKLIEYKQKIDDSINKEYDKLIDDLYKGN